MDPGMVASIIVKKLLKNKNNVINIKLLLFSIHHLPTTA